MSTVTSISPAEFKEGQNPSMLRDEFYWLGQINKASIVLNVRDKLLERNLAARIALGLRAVLDEGNSDLKFRPFRVIDFEPRLIEKAGVEATKLHVGRSSQDMHATYRSAIMRDNLLAVAESLSRIMKQLLVIADKHRATVVPNYTNGVAAQPNSYAHYLFGFLCALRRDAQRIRELYARINRCAMGTCVLNGSCWPLERRKMAELLGFDGPVEDAYDAAQYKSTDEAVELSSIFTSIGLHVCTFIQDIMVQYAQPRPWILLAEGGENTYVSSAMPQKRNPGLMIYTRISAGKLMGSAQEILILAHNIVPGMTDPKTPSDNTARFKQALDALGRFSKVLKALRISAARAEEELNLDWTCSQEIADRLARDYGLPFRLAHHVASSVVSDAKARNINSAGYQYTDFCKIYSKVITSECPSESAHCPLSEDEFKEALDPRKIVFNRKTEGGSQPEELDKAFARFESFIRDNDRWIDLRKKQISEAAGLLEELFSVYLK